MSLPPCAHSQAFVDAQNTITNSHLASYPHREAFREKYTTITIINARLTALYDYEKFGCPFKRGNAFYYFHNSGLQAQRQLFSY